MVNYVAGFYRHGQSFDDATLRAVLVALHSLNAGFFPASMPTSRDNSARFHVPEDYDRSLVPRGYYITGNVARIPFECANGIRLAFTESNTPRNMPANIIMEFTDHTLATNGWRLSRLVEIFKSVIASFVPDYATLYDEAHRARPTYDEHLFDYDMRRVPTGLYWVNYYSRDWVANIGDKRLRDLSKHVAVVEWLADDGVLIAIQEEPYDESNPAHRERQLFLEQKILDLPAVQARFPNRGL